MACIFYNKPYTFSLAEKMNENKRKNEYIQQALPLLFGTLLRKAALPIILQWKKCRFFLCVFAEKM